MGRQTEIDLRRQRRKDCREIAMQISRSDTMYLLEKAISGYESKGAAAELAVRQLLTDLRHYCDRRDIDIEDPLEDSLEAFLEECDSSEE
jgi:hypothetical protein